jgi:hypothetical protein
MNPDLTTNKEKKTRKRNGLNQFETKQPTKKKSDKKNSQKRFVASPNTRKMDGRTQQGPRAKKPKLTSSPLDNIMSGLDETSKIAAKGQQEISKIEQVAQLNTGGRPLLNTRSVGVDLAIAEFLTTVRSEAIALRNQHGGEVEIEVRLGRVCAKSTKVSFGFVVCFVLFCFIPFLVWVG